MSNFPSLEEAFSFGARFHGAEYFRDGRVAIQELEPNGVLAQVRGTRNYRVIVSIGDADTPTGTCSCPAFDRGPCKHMWAALLAARGSPGQFGDRVRNLLQRRPDGGLGSRIRASGRGVSTPEWALRLRKLQPSSEPEQPVLREGERDGRLVYVLEAFPEAWTNELRVTISWQTRLKRGGWSALRASPPGGLGVSEGLPVEDRHLLAALRGARDPVSMRWEAPTRHLYLDREQAELLLPLIGSTSRLFLQRAHGGKLEPLALDAGELWKFGLALSRLDARSECVVDGVLARGTERVAIADVALAVGSGHFVNAGRLARFDARGAEHWIRALRESGPIHAPLDEQKLLLRDLVSRPRTPLMDLDGVECEPTPPPTARLWIEKPGQHARAADVLTARLEFDYAGVRALALDDRPLLSSLDGERWIRRDAAAEEAFLARFVECGGSRGARKLSLRAGDLPQIVRTLLDEGWHVEAEGLRYVSAGLVSVAVRSGIDWFDLEGSLAFGDRSATLPELLEAVRRRSTTIVLGDGVVGVLPEEWLERWSLLAALGKSADGGLRFAHSQAFLLDALLAAEKDVRADAVFETARARLASFRGIEPVQEPPGFRGELRPYQREGLGWLHFLEQLGFGGCLADDMGLGKTVQVLALLERRRESGVARRASLVVAPRSLTFNWIDEAAHFAPSLKVLEYTGADREALRGSFEEFDLVVTTYGTLRRDALLLKEHRFDWAILDEAQAIKNPTSLVARAARLLTADHRLALSGTPIENHLGELWSLFEFLNPGMLGRSSAFRELASARTDTDLGDDGKRLLSTAVRPFLLRRTKDEVLQELPEKTEQTLHCEMGRAQRRAYDELRAHYRATLLGHVDDDFAKMQFHVLEALLRLRQLACHPALLDEAKQSEPSAKLDALFPLLDEVQESGHKALVFSQFTSFLALVRAQLDARGITYEYLDGRTRDRAERVERFQTDPACPFFLISLKAGGFGLNLTAADYVFLLDPWWNPAVESQAIDRTHRIGQTRKVFAYRLICKDTVEERVLELQAKKRELFDAILGSGRTPLSGLTRSDLERLLS